MPTRARRRRAGLLRKYGLLPSAGGEAVGRVLVSTADLSASAVTGQRVLLTLGDHLGSTSTVIDRETGELVEAVAYTSYGQSESDVGPDRYKGLREDVRFTGNEDDVEVGLTAFAKRYYAPALGRWASPDPLAVHAPGDADLNLYAYVHGRVYAATDPLGLDCDSSTTTCNPVSSNAAGAPTDSRGEEVVNSLDRVVAGVSSLDAIDQRRSDPKQMTSLAPTQHEGIFGDVVRRDAARPRARHVPTSPKQPELGTGPAFQVTFAQQAAAGIGTAAVVGGEAGALLADTKQGHRWLTTTATPSSGKESLPLFGSGFGFGASAGYTLNITAHLDSSQVDGASTSAMDVNSTYSGAKTLPTLRLELGLALWGGSVGIGNGRVQSVTLSLGPQYGFFFGTVPQQTKVER